MVFGALFQEVERRRVAAEKHADWHCTYLFKARGTGEMLFAQQSSSADGSQVQYLITYRDTRSGCGIVSRTEYPIRKVFKGEMAFWVHGYKASSCGHLFYQS